MKTIHLDPAGGPATARITIGQGQVAAFAMYIFDSQRLNPHQIGNGVTPPSIQSVSMGPVNALTGGFLTWDVAVAPFTTSGEPYSITIDVLQNGSIANTFNDSGAFKAGEVLKIHDSAAIA